MSDTIVHTTCRRCGLDIEGPHRDYVLGNTVYIDRGGDKYCRDTKNAGFLHVPPEPDNVVEIGVDWHNAVHEQTRQQKAVAQSRLKRALLQAGRAVDRNDWDAYDAWITQAAEMRRDMGD